HSVRRANPDPLPPAVACEQLAACLLESVALLRVTRLSLCEGELPPCASSHVSLPRSVAPPGEGPIPDPTARAACEPREGSVPDRRYTAEPGSRSGYSALER